MITWKDFNYESNSFSNIIHYYICTCYRESIITVKWIKKNEIKMVSCLNLVSETSTWNFILVMLFTRLLHIILYTQLWHVCSCIDQWNPNARSLRVELISVILYLHGRDDKRVRNGQIANVRTISSFRSIHLSRQIRPCRRKQTISRQRTRYGQCVFVTHRANSRDSLTDDAFVSLLRARARREIYGHAKISCTC